MKQSIRRVLRSITEVALCLLVVALIAWQALRLFVGPALLFDPSPAWLCTPDQLKLSHQAWDVQCASGDTVKAWFMPAGDEHRGLVFMCRSLSANMSYDLEYADLWREMGFDVLLFDYRGFGRSTGRPAENSMYEDAQMVWQHAVQKLTLEPGSVILYGRGGGGAVAARLANQVVPAGLVLESVYPDWRVQARHAGMRFGALLAGNALDTVTPASKVSCPVLVIHSQEDDVVPLKHGRRVFDVIPGPKELLITHGHHGDSIYASRQDYHDAVNRLARVAGFSSQENEVF